jgi:hypothetical protein
MPKICLSYRRSDSPALVGRVYDRLVARYGGESVFMDLTGIPYGADFRERILNAWRGAHVLVAIIGPGWLGEQGGGPARIDDKLDPVRVEIETALREGILIIPALIDSAKMPPAQRLPRSIGELAYRNAMPIDSGLDFEPHVQRLLRAIDQVLGIDSVSDETQSGSVAAVSKKPAAVFQTAVAWCGRLWPYFVVPVILLVLAHYLIVMRWDRDTLYLRLFAVIIPLVSGYLLLRRLRLGVTTATLLGLLVGVVAVAAMMAVVGLIDHEAILPTTASGWQEPLEFVVTITLATGAGNLLARVVKPVMLGGRRLF